MIDDGSITDVFSLLICRSDNSMLENAPAVDMKIMVCPAYGDSVEHLQSDYAYDCAAYAETVQHGQAISMSDLNDDHTYDSPAYKETVWHQKAITMNEYDCPTDGNSHQALTVNDDRTYDRPAYENSVHHQKAVAMNEYDCPETVQHQHVVTRNGLTGDHTYDNRETKFSLLSHRTDNPMYIATTEDNKDSISEDHIYEHIVVRPGDHFNFYQNEDH